MKRKSFLLSLILCFISIFAVTLYGCGEEPETFTLEVSGNDNIVYYVGDDFDLEVYDFFLTSSKTNNKEELDISDISVQMPNMSTEGEKTVKITYKGKTYSFKIIVKSTAQKKEDINTKFREFLSNYLSNGKTGELTVSLSTDLTSKYFGEEVKVNSNDVLVDFSQFGLNENKLFNYVYKSLVDNVVKKSLTPSETTIENSTNFKFVLNLYDALNNIIADLQSFDYYDYLMKDVIFTEELPYYSNTATETLANFFGIPENSVGYEFLGQLIYTNLSKLINKQGIQYTTLVDQFYEIVYGYSADDAKKDFIKAVYDEYKDVDNHIISKFYEIVAKNDLIILQLPLEYNEYLMEEYGEFVAINDQYHYYDEDIPTEMKAFLQDYISYNKQLIEVLEDTIFYGLNSGSMAEYAEDITNACKNIIDLYEENAEKYVFHKYVNTFDGYYTDWYIYTVDGYVQALYDIFSCYSTDFETHLVDFIKTMQLDFAFVDFTFNTYLGYEFDETDVQTLTNVFWDVVYPENTEIDYEEDINKFLQIVANLDETEAQEYAQLIYAQIGEFDQNFLSKAYEIYEKNRYVVYKDGEELNNESTRVLLNNFAKAESLLIKAIEDCFATLVCDGIFDYDSLIYDVKECFLQIKQHNEICEENEYYLYDEIVGGFITDDIGPMYDILDLYEGDLLTFALTVGKNFGIVEQLIDYVEFELTKYPVYYDEYDEDEDIYYFYDEENDNYFWSYTEYYWKGLDLINEEDTQEIANFIYDLIEGKEVDVPQFIIHVARMFGICDESQVEDLIADFNTNGYTTVLSDYLEGQTVHISEDEEVNTEFKEKLIAFVAYIEKLTAEEFNQEEFITLLEDFVNFASDNGAIDGYSQLALGLAISIANGTYVDFIKDYQLVEFALLYADMSFELGLDIDDMQIVSEFIYNLIDGQEVDYEDFAAEIFEILGLLPKEDILKYIDQYKENGYITLLSDYFENYLSYGDGLTEEEIVIIDLIKSIEKITSEQFDESEVIDNLNDFLQVSLNHVDYGIEEFALELGVILTNYVFDVEGISKELVSYYDYELKEALTYVVSQILGLEENSVGYNEVSDLAASFINGYVDDSLNFENIYNDLDAIINNNCDEKTKTYAKSIETMLIVLIGNETEIDYNDLFAFIELPPQIESINYNQLIAKLTDGQTFEDVLKFDNIYTQFYFDEQGNISSETLSIKLDINFDVMISSLIGSISLDFSIKF